jgi:hypothetical protein
LDLEHFFLSEYNWSIRSVYDAYEWALCYLHRAHRRKRLNSKCCPSKSVTYRTFVHINAIPLLYRVPEFFFFLQSRDGLRSEFSSSGTIATSGASRNWCGNFSRNISSESRQMASFHVGMLSWWAEGSVHLSL